MAILQASSAQNHLVVAFWILCLASLVLASRERVSLRTTVEGGVCLGLAVLTKGSAFVLAPPLAVWAGLVLVRELRWRALGHIALAGLIVVGLNAAHWARNLAVFGSPLGPPADSALYANSAFTVQTLAERVIQEISLHLATPIHVLNDAISTAVNGLARTLHLDLNDPNTIWPGSTWTVPGFTTHEDYTGNLLALALIVAVAAVVLVRHRGLKLTYLAAIGLGFLLYSGYVRWQLYNSRLDLPLFVMAAPLAGAVIGQWRRSLVIALAFVLALGSTPWLFLGKDRPLIGDRSVLTTSRTDQYFANRPDLRVPYVAIASAIRESDCRDVGLYVVNDDPWDYPLWKLLNPTGQEVVLRHVMVSNATARMESTQVPCMIVFVNAASGAPQMYRGSEYRLAVASPPLYLYRLW
jgi:hypothetical protein